MKVYAVTEGEYSDYHIVGIFASLKAATKCAAESIEKEKAEYAEQGRTFCGTACHYSIETYVLGKPNEGESWHVDPHTAEVIFDAEEWQKREAICWELYREECEREDVEWHRQNPGKKRKVYSTGCGPTVEMGNLT